MQERNPQARHEAAAYNGWNIDGAFDVLNVVPHEVRHENLGDGLLFPFRTEEGSRRDITLYPDQSVVHVSADDAIVALDHVEGPEVEGENEALIFERRKPHDSHRLRINKEGDVQLLITSKRLKNGARLGAAGESPDAQLVASNAGTGGSESPTTPEKQPRLTFTGRMGKDLEVGQNRGGTWFARLPVAERYEEDGEQRTRWHKVYTTGKRAETLRDKFTSGALHKGDLVTVDGYAQMHPKVGKGGKPLLNQDGTLQTERRIYAVHVKVR